MIIGVPKETVPGETRVASTPEIVGKLIAKGFEVVVEQGAGAAASFTDQAFEAAGAKITDRAGALGADIVVHRECHILGFAPECIAGPLSRAGMARFSPPDRDNRAAVVAELVDKSYFLARYAHFSPL